MTWSSLLKHLRLHRCVLKREGGSHSLWLNPSSGALEAVPRHTEIPDSLARNICRGLGIPLIGRPHFDTAQTVTAFFDRRIKAQ